MNNTGNHGGTEMRTIVKTVTKQGTRLGARCTNTTRHLDGKATGLRVYVTVWHDASPRHGRNAADMVLSLLKGDGTKGTLETLAEVVVPNGTEDDVAAFLAEHGVQR